MAKPTKKKAAAKKPSAPAKAKKTAKAKKAKAEKAPKEKPAKAPKVKPVAPAAPSVNEATASVAVVEEISAPESSSSSPSVAAEPAAEVSSAVQSLAKSLAKIISSHPRTLTRKEIAEVVEKTPQFMFANPIFDDAKKTFVIEVSDATGKMTIPSKGSYAFFG